MGSKARFGGMVRGILAAAALLVGGSVASAGTIASSPLSAVAGPNNIQLTFTPSDQFSSPSGTFSFTGGATGGIFSITGGSYDTTSPGSASASLSLMGFSLPDATFHNDPSASLEVLDLTSYSSSGHVKMLFDENVGVTDPAGSQILVFLDTRAGVGNASLVAVPAPASVFGGGVLLAGLGLASAVRAKKRQAE